MKRIQLKTTNRMQRIIPSSVSIAKTLGIVALALGSFTMKAGEGTEAALKTENTIRTGIQFPKLSQPVKNEKVKVVFTTDETGHVTYCLAKTANAELKKSLEAQFRKFRLVDTRANVAYSIVINLKTL
jgi:hypothetical protein